MDIVLSKKGVKCAVLQISDVQIVITAYDNIFQNSLPKFPGKEIVLNPLGGSSDPGIMLACLPTFPSRLNHNCAPPTHSNQNRFKIELVDITNQF